MATGGILNIWNRSLLSIGARSTVGSLNEASTEANACNVFFTPVFESLARSAYWNCLRQQAVLTLLAAAAGTPENQNGTTLPIPPQPWLYSYQVPADCLQSRYIVPTFPPTGNGPVPISPAMVAAQGWIGGQGQIPFKIAYGTDAQNNPLQIILTNQSQAQLVYTVNQPNPQTWDSLFQQAAVASLAAYLVPALSLNLPLMGAQIKNAEAMIAQARIRDGDEGSTCQDHIPDWITARNGGASYYGLSGSGQYGGWGNMVWPG